jgi:hypothetical protein
VRYLEIGVRSPRDNYTRIPAALRLGCDPALTDEQFLGIMSWPSARTLATFALLGARFDLIFVDGDHCYAGCRADVAAALPLLAVGGYLVMHDCLPDDAAMTAEPRPPGGAPWCGGAYRVWHEVCHTTSQHVVGCVAVDHGCGVISSGARLLPHAPDGIPVGPWQLDAYELSREYRTITLPQLREVLP